MVSVPYATRSHNPQGAIAVYHLKWDFEPQTDRDRIERAIEHYLEAKERANRLSHPLTLGVDTFYVTIFPPSPELPYDVQFRLRAHRQERTTSFTVRSPNATSSRGVLNPYLSRTPRWVFVEDRVFVEVDVQAKVPVGSSKNETTLLGITPWTR